MIVVIATLTVKPGSQSELIAAAKLGIAETRKEKGCLLYDLHTSATDPERMVFVEKWETRDDLTAHSKMPHLKAWRDASAPHVLSRTIEIIHPEKVETY